jgi:MoxR-like ATPase
MTPREFQESFHAARAQVHRVVVGLDRVVDGVLAALFADGNVLLEGLPGLGKTRLVTSLAQALDLVASRIQFTPDLMPADITGTHLVVEDERGGKHFSLHKGPIFANVILADEINRATPKTQSALLEAMQERQVTLLGNTLALPQPFIVVATQNPLEMEGTYPLPEAQLDRFISKLKLTLPSEEALLAILERTTGTVRDRPSAVLDAAKIHEMRGTVLAVPVSPETARLAVRILLCTHPEHPNTPDSVRKFVRFGASPRGVQAMVLLGKVKALLERGDARQPVLSPEDLSAVAADCLRHRVILSFEGESENVDVDALIADATDAARRSLKGR